ncbi:voltage-dependent calcium channel subunit alpha-2/delta-4-like [Diaphorina citri]|uniref:Voltage-dependent calcium channel subunit alpha-2/delta-4-like n=1 Tax=Diaphorina citri TaxID=121845 RepID=A0A3Q0IUF2_DIACI|nr:voltage-dependent calcium channel subunit alpha-2/delta-4-like [Diaphorina citri]
MQQAPLLFQCIMDAAEEMAESFNYTERKYQRFAYYNVNGETEGGPTRPANLSEQFDEPPYKNTLKLGLELTPDRHFFNIPVNTEYSVVHLPINVYDGCKYCIMDAAEEMAESFNYTERKYQRFAYYNVNGETEGGPTRPANLSEQFDEPPYKNTLKLGLELTPDRHFFNIPVNTEYSVVHLPINVYDGYFRTYPALKWMSADKEDAPAEDLIFDCRNRQWYIQATTCSKDVVILVDNSGSMAGMRNTTAKLVLHSLLQTFSNNDFINIFKFNLTVDTIVPCLGNYSLVQATPENINLFKQAVIELYPEGKANFSAAFVKAFEVLKKYREVKSCPEKICNQAIMLVTDSVPGNLTEVFEAYNRINDSGTEETIPVRVFTYLVGKEVTNVREIQWMACLNRGYYVHIHTLEEVREDVLKYIPVMARPLVLQGDQHPLSWTHLFADITQRNGTETSDFQKYRMLTSVSVPAYDRKINSNNQTTRADILGVAGTDVPMSDFLKLTMPYKIGVNGYAFIITNNGYVLLHPDLRPVKDGHLKENYNSVDLTEIELLTYDRKINSNNQTTRADILGVAGTDVPMSDFLKLTMPYKEASQMCHWLFAFRVELVEKYNASLRFVATQGGLTRWQYIKDPQSGEDQFGETDKLALEENWYKSAVLQHHLNPEAFVFSVPHKIGLSSGTKDFQVTATHAIFTKDGGLEAPGSVVGLKLSHAALRTRFFGFTSKTCRDCMESCTSDELDCYVIDGNGYVIISEEHEHTGLFFGEMEGAIMESMVAKNIFRKIRMFDYQAMCYKHVNSTSSASFLANVSCPPGSLTSPSRPFFVKPIPHTNLLLIVVNTLYQSCYRRFESESTRIKYNISNNNQYDKTYFMYDHYMRTDPNAQDPACNKHYINLLPRRRMAGCFNQHPKEKYVTLCGGGATMSMSLALLVVLIGTIAFMS